MIATYGFYFARPWWLLGCLLAVPAVWMGLRYLSAFSRVRRAVAVTLRAIVIILLAALLARPLLTKTAEGLVLLAVVDKSQSVPDELQKAANSFLSDALEDRGNEDRLAVIDVAEAAAISKLPDYDPTVRERNTALSGGQSRLASGVQMAMAIAPPDSAARILLISDGNETDGDLIEAARIAGANGIPIDVLPLVYQYDHEVVFKRIAAPARAKGNETVPLRFVLTSTCQSGGSLLLNLNGKGVDLDPNSSGMAAKVKLTPGTNVKTVSLPVGDSGLHEFEAFFVPDGPQSDGISRNNRASAMTFVATPGNVLVIDSSQGEGDQIARALRQAGLDVRQGNPTCLEGGPAELVTTGAVILVNTHSSSFTHQQQEMLRRYVQDMGGGLAMVGGPDSFGAGGWIGSPIAEVLPVDLDPPQKKQMPKGALVLIMHACEMPRGNYWGKTVAIASVSALSRLDLAGVLDYGWNMGDSNWVYPLGPVGDKKEVISAIKQMQMGDMPDFHAPMQAAYDKLKDCDAAQRHIIVISDGDPAPPSDKLLGKMKEAGITCTGVAVFPHNPTFVQSLVRIAKETGGRFYNVKDPSKLPQIFVKEATVVRRALIVEESFSPKVTSGLSELVKGLGASPPNLDGYVLTGPKGGLNQIVLESAKGDPILATGQAGLGRCVAFTSSADSRWASHWLQWPGYERFWEQMARWVCKSSHQSDCEVVCEADGRNVTVNVEAVDEEGNFVQLAEIVGQVINPDVQAKPLALSQVGPGTYRAEFQAAGPGSYLVNLRYKKVGQADSVRLAQSAVTVPYAAEFRDLSDNSALLNEVARVTGGRVIGPDAAQADLFNRSGLKFPKTALPLTKHLILIWIAMFLMDVAVRRVAVDPRAVARRIAALAAKLRPTAAASATLGRLAGRRKRVREGLAAKTQSRFASRRHEAPEAPSPPLRVADVPKEHPAPQSADQQDRQEQPVERQDASHLQRLLKAKRKSSDRLQKDTDQSGDT